MQTLVVAARDWRLTPAEIAAEYGIGETQVKEALACYQLHAQEIDRAGGVSSWDRVARRRSR